MLALSLDAAGMADGCAAAIAGEAFATGASVGRFGGKLSADAMAPTNPPVPGVNVVPAVCDGGRSTGRATGCGWAVAAGKAVSLLAIAESASIALAMASASRFCGSDI